MQAPIWNSHVSVWDRPIGGRVLIVFLSVVMIYAKNRFIYTQHSVECCDQDFTIAQRIIKINNSSCLL